MEIKDLTGLSEPLKKLIEVVSQGVGAISKPYLIRKTADAKAYEIEVVAESIKKNQESLKQIGYNEEKLSLMSLDNNSIKDELNLQERTKQRIDFKEQKRQKNIEDVTQKAAKNLESESEVSDEPVDEDWITRFFNYAEDISNEEMKELWGKILAGEIKRPKSYSLRTLNILRNLSKEEANVFLKFAALSIKSGTTSFILNFKDEKLLEEKYKLNFNDRLLLEELGFLAANDLQFRIGKTDDKPRQVIFFLGDTCVIQNKLENKPEQQLEVLAFTKIGQELLNLVNVSPELDYIQLLASKLDRKNGSVQYGKVLEFLQNGQFRHSQLIDVPPTKKEQKESEEQKDNENKK